MITRIVIQRRPPIAGMPDNKLDIVVCTDKGGVHYKSLEGEHSTRILAWFITMLDLEGHERV